MTTPRSVFDALANAKAANGAGGWSWRSSDDPGLFWLWHHGRECGCVSLEPDKVTRRAVLMDSIVKYLNTEEP
jgi:hypothetical protein